LQFRSFFAYHETVENGVEYSPGATKKDGRILVLAATIITGLRLARDRGREARRSA